jgi:Ran GTPase-activating protein (RanGAP) involved in mRNA processing and transport
MHTSDVSGPISIASSEVDEPRRPGVSLDEQDDAQEREADFSSTAPRPEETLGWLDLRANRLGNAGAHTLSHMRHLAAINRLILCGNEIGDEGISTLMASPNVSRLELLDLRGNRIGPEGVRAIASCPHLGQLSTLKLDGNLVTDDGVRMLADSDYLPALRTLSLGRCRLTEQAAWALAASNKLQLQQLSLKRNRIGAGGVRVLVSGGLALQLRNLILCRNPVGDEGSEWFASSTKLAVLERLDLTCTEIGNRGALALSRAEIPSLRVLQLGRNHIGLEGVEALHRAPGLSQAELILVGNLTGQGAARPSSSREARWFGLESG